jgi:hypothetical protein
MNDFLGLSLCCSAQGARSRLVGFPGWPPGSVPGVESGEDRPWSFDRHSPDGAFCAAVDFLDDERAPCDGSEIGIELISGFHFLSPSIVFRFRSLTTKSDSARTVY